jgi:preprotein translocase subunit SecG
MGPTITVIATRGVIVAVLTYSGNSTGVSKVIYLARSQLALSSSRSRSQVLPATTFRLAGVVDGLMV